MRHQDAIKMIYHKNIPKNGVNIMRIVKILLLCIIIGILNTIAVTSANEMPKKYVDQALDLMEGQWYDNNNNLVVNISNRKINDCLVIAGFDFAGGRSNAKGIFRIAEQQGYRDLIIEWHISHTAQDKLVLNNTLFLHKESVGVQYYESVGGVHLGMTKQQLLAKYGSPSHNLTAKGTNSLCGVMVPSWLYASDGWLVTFNADVIDRIVIFNGGTRKLDRTGLNCLNSMDSFASAYGTSKSQIMSIGHGEYLIFFDYPRSIMLSPYFS